jgi:hypothetical protein
MFIDVGIFGTKRFFVGSAGTDSSIAEDEPIKGDTVV